MIVNVGQIIENADLNYIEKSQENELSLSVLIEYAGNQIILGGDATVDSWGENKRQLNRQDITLKASIVKLPHHGAKKDCTPDVIDHLYRNQDEGDRIAIISANGKSHPSTETLKILADKKIKPFCTYLAKDCGGDIVKRFHNLPDIEPEIKRYLNTLADSDISMKQLCQGDILLSLKDDGSYTITTELDHPCPYRGFQGLLAS